MNFIKSLFKKTCFLTFLILAGIIGRAQNNAIDTWFNQAAIFMQKAEFEQALVTLKKITDKIPGNERALMTMATAYDSLKKYGDAAACYEQLTLLLPNNANHQTGAGWYFMLNKQYDRSEIYCLKALKLNDCSFANYLNLGHLYGFLKQKKKSLEYYYKAVSYLPNRQAYEAILADFALIEKEGNYPYRTAPYVNMVKHFFANEYLAKEYGNEILDSLYQLTSFKNFATDSDPILNLKERFIWVEAKNKTMRTYVLRDFYVTLGWLNFYHYSKSLAITKYFSNAIAISNDLQDTVFNIKLLHQLGRENYNEGGDGSVKLAFDMTLQYNYRELLYPITIELGDRMFTKNKFDSAFFYYRLGFSSADESGVPGAKNIAINRLIRMFGNENKMDSVHFYYTLSKNLRSPKTADIKIEFIDDLFYCRQIRYAGNAVAAIKKANELIRLYAAEKRVNISDLYEEIGMANYELLQKKEAASYFREAIRLNNVYTDNNPKEEGPFPLEERYLSFEHLKRMALAEKNTGELYELSEQTKANILYPRLTGKRYVSPVISMSSIAKNLKKEEMVISYSGSSKSNIAFGIGISQEALLLVKEDHLQLELLVKKHAEVNWDSSLSRARKAISGLNIHKLSDEQRTNLIQVAIIFNYLNMLMNGDNTRGVILSGQQSKANKSQSDMLAYNDILYQQYVKPFEKMLAGKTTIYISADLLTTLIPFEALTNEEGKYLGDLYNIIYVPSLSSQAILKSAERAGNKKMLAIGNPVYSGFEPQKTRGRAYDIDVFQHGLAKWSDLPGTEKEIGSIKNVLDEVTVIDKNNLTEGHIKALNQSGELAKYDILHFAVHGMTSMEDYRNNALILSEPGGSYEDGFLQFDEIASLKLNAQLVCLSACETAAGLPSETEEVKNLPVAFFLAGAKSVIASWWKIDDEATGIFMSSFYSLVFKENKSYAQALQLTRQKFILGKFGEKYKPPYFWAAFKYFGH